MTLSPYYVETNMIILKMSWDEIDLSDFLIWSNCMFVVTWHQWHSLSDHFGDLTTLDINWRSLHTKNLL